MDSGSRGGGMELSSGNKFARSRMNISLKNAFGVVLGTWYLLHNILISPVITYPVAVSARILSNIPSTYI